MSRFFGVAVKDGRDWIIAEKNVGMWHRGVEKGAEALDNAWRRADHVRRQREAGSICTVVTWCAILFCLFYFWAANP